MLLKIMPRIFWIVALALLLVAFFGASRGTEPVLFMALLFRSVIAVIAGTMLALLVIDWRHRAGSSRP